jgi:hypothetical protein
MTKQLTKDDAAYHTTTMSLNSQKINNFTDKLQPTENVGKSKFMLKNEGRTHLLDNETELMSVKSFYKKFGSTEPPIPKNSTITITEGTLGSM